MVTFILAIAASISLAIYFLSSIAYFRAFRLMGYRRAWFGIFPILREYGVCEAVRLSHARILTVAIPIDIFKFFPIVFVFLGWLSKDSIVMASVLGLASFLFSGWKFTNMLAILYGMRPRKWILIGHVLYFCPLVAHIMFLIADKKKVGWVVD